MSAETIIESTGSRLAAARRRAGLTQAQLAARLGKSRSLVGNAENGADKITLDQALEFAHALGCDPAEIDGRLASTKRAGAK